MPRHTCGLAIIVSETRVTRKALEQETTKELITEAPINTTPAWGRLAAN